jgi:hypothetical protein
MSELTDEEFVASDEHGTARHAEGTALPRRGAGHRVGAEEAPAEPAESGEEQEPPQGMSSHSMTVVGPRRVAVAAGTPCPSTRSYRMAMDSVRLTAFSHGAG